MARIERRVRVVTPRARRGGASRPTPEEVRSPSARPHQHRRRRARSPSASPAAAPSASTPPRSLSPPRRATGSSSIAARRLSRLRRRLRPLGRGGGGGRHPVRHGSSELGTQFEVRLAGGGLRLRVREGAVALRRSGRTHVARCRRRVDPHRRRRRPHRRRWPAFGAAVGVDAGDRAPLSTLDGRSLGEFLAWASSGRAGRRIEGSVARPASRRGDRPCTARSPGLTPGAVAGRRPAQLRARIRLTRQHSIGRSAGSARSSPRARDEAVPGPPPRPCCRSPSRSERARRGAAGRPRRRPATPAGRWPRPSRCCGRRGLDLVWSSALVRPRDAGGEPSRGPARRARSSTSCSPPSRWRSAPEPSGRLVIVARAGAAASRRARRHRPPRRQRGAAGRTPRSSSRRLGRRARSGRDGGYRLDRAPPRRLPGAGAAARLRRRRERAAATVAAGVERTGRLRPRAGAPHRRRASSSPPTATPSSATIPAGREALSRARVEALPHLGRRPLPHPPLAARGEPAATTPRQIHVRGGEQDEVLVELDGLRLYSTRSTSRTSRASSASSTRRPSAASNSSPAAFPPSTAIASAASSIVTSATPSASRVAPSWGSASPTLLATHRRGSTRSGRWPAGWWSARRGYLDLVARPRRRTAEAQLDPRYYDAFAKFESRRRRAHHASPLEALAARDALHFALDTGDEQADAALRRPLLLGAAPRPPGRRGWSRRPWPRWPTVDRDRRGTVTSSRRRRRGGRSAELPGLGRRTGVVAAAVGALLLRWGAEVRRLTAVLRLRQSHRRPRSALPPRRRRATCASTSSPPATPTAPSPACGCALAPDWTARAGRPLGPPVLHRRPPDSARGANAVWQPLPDTTLHLCLGALRPVAGDRRAADRGRGRPLLAGAVVASTASLGFEQDLGRGIHLRGRPATRSSSPTSVPATRTCSPRIKLLPEAEPDRVQVAAESGRADGVELAVRSLGGGPRRLVGSPTPGRLGQRPGRRPPGGAELGPAPRRRRQRRAPAGATPGAWRLGAVSHSGWPTTAVSAPAAVARRRREPRARATPSANATRARNPVYQRLDLRAVRNLSVRPGRAGAWSSKSTNLLDRDNVCCVDDVHRSTGCRTASVSRPAPRRRLAAARPLLRRLLALLSGPPPSPSFRAVRQTPRSPPKPERLFPSPAGVRVRCR